MHRPCSIWLLPVNATKSTCSLPPGKNAQLLLRFDVVFKLLCFFQDLRTTILLKRAIFDFLRVFLHLQPEHIYRRHPMDTMAVKLQERIPTGDSQFTPGIKPTNQKVHYLARNVRVLEGSRLLAGSHLTSKISNFSTSFVGSK